MSVSFDGKVMAMTGEGGGIGGEHAVLLASREAKLVNDVGGGTDGVGGDAGRPQPLVDKLARLGANSVASTDETAETGSADQLIPTAVEAFGDVHGFVTTPGLPARQSPVQHDGRPVPLDAVNLRAAFAPICAKAGAAALTEVWHKNSAGTGCR